MDWLDHLHHLREEDQKQQEKSAQQLDMSILDRREQANAVLKVAQAHSLLRRMNNALLDGKGLIDSLDSVEGYDETIALVWQGSFSQACRPAPDNPAPVHYVLISAKGRDIYINHKKCQITPEAIKAALLHAAKAPLNKSPHT